MWCLSEIVKKIWLALVDSWNLKNITSITSIPSVPDICNINVYEKYMQIIYSDYVLENARNFSSKGTASLNDFWVQERSKTPGPLYIGYIFR